MRARHHTVSAFLLENFSRDAANGRRVAMLAKATGRVIQVSPRDAAVRKHFYSLDVDEGRRDDAVEVALSEIENVAAPLIDSLRRGDFPAGEGRLALALFVAMCWQRTPVAREQTASLLEQATHALFTESMKLDPEMAQRALEDHAMSRDEIESFRKKMVEDLEAGRLGFEMPQNAMIKHFLDGAQSASLILFMLDWSLVRLPDDSPEFVIGDTPVSLYDPKPAFPGGGAGLLSSPLVQVFLPLAPHIGLLAEASEEMWLWARDHLEALYQMSPDDRIAAVAEHEGGWGEGQPTAEFAQDLNLRSYAACDRYIFGSQKAVQDVRAMRTTYARRLIEVAPRPPRLHILESAVGPATTPWARSQRRSPHGLATSNVAGHAHDWKRDSSRVRLHRSSPGRLGGAAAVAGLGQSRDGA